VSTEGTALRVLFESSLNLRRPGTGADAAADVHTNRAHSHNSRGALVLATTVSTSAPVPGCPLNGPDFYAGLVPPSGLATAGNDRQQVVKGATVVLVAAWFLRPAVRGTRMK
jgi:hypothetical protein